MQKNSYAFRNTECIIKKLLSSVSLCLVQWPREDGLLWKLKKQSQVEQTKSHLSELMKVMNFYISLSDSGH